MNPVKSDLSRAISQADSTKGSTKVTFVVV
jgi:hypothetical protein